MPTINAEYILDQEITKIEKELQNEITVDKPKTQEYVMPLDAAVKLIKKNINQIPSQDIFSGMLCPEWNVLSAIMAYDSLFLLGSYQMISDVLNFSSPSTFLPKISGQYERIRTRSEKLWYYIGLHLLKERLSIGDALYQIAKYPNQSKARLFALNEMGLEVAPKTSEREIKELHQAILAENIEQIKERLTESNCDLKGPNGMTPMQLIFDKYKGIFEQVKLTPGDLSKNYYPKIRDILVLLLLKGALINSEEQQIAIKLGVDVVSIRNLMMSKLLTEGRQYSLLFRKIEEEQNEIKRILQDAAIKIEELAAEELKQNKKISSLENNSEITTSAVQDIIAVVAEQQKQIDEQRRIIEQQQLTILILLGQNPNQFRALEQHTPSSSNQLAESTRLALPSPQTPSSFFTQLSQARKPEDVPLCTLDSSLGKIG